MPLPSSMITFLFFCSFYLKADLYISEVCVLRNIEKIETVASAYSIFCEKIFVLLGGKSSVKMLFCLI